MKCPHHTQVPFSEFKVHAGKYREDSFTNQLQEDEIANAHKRVQRCLREYPTCSEGGVLCMTFVKAKGVAFWNCSKGREHAIELDTFKARKRVPHKAYLTEHELNALASGDDSDCHCEECANSDCRCEECSGLDAP